VHALRTLLALLLLVLTAGASTYQVRWGDTLGSVASRFGVSVSSLAAANGISDPNRVQAGHVLRIPAPGRAAAATAGGVHVVGRGETLGHIAARHGTTVTALAEANGLRNPNLIRVGQRLRVPGGGRWICPVHGGARFVADFGAPRGDRRHEGVDLLAPKGTPVVANVAGVVMYGISPRGGLHYYLHGDNGVLYYGSHLATFVGGARRVRAGETIGTVGDSGNARGGPPHLHFERKPGGGPPTDPYPGLLRACPRR
jgi:murein DD-endopeptidase MepM/ murein hydrolase activator NlpD